MSKTHDHNPMRPPSLLFVLVNTAAFPAAIPTPPFAFLSRVCFQNKAFSIPKASPSILARLASHCAAAASLPLARFKERICFASKVDLVEVELD